MTRARGRASYQGGETCGGGGMQSHGMTGGEEDVDRHHRRQRMKTTLFLSHYCAIGSEQWSFRPFSPFYETRLALLVD